MYIYIYALPTDACKDNADIVVAPSLSMHVAAKNGFTWAEIISI